MSNEEEEFKKYRGLRKIDNDEALRKIQDNGGEYVVEIPSGVKGVGKGLALGIPGQYVIGRVKIVGAEPKEEIEDKEDIERESIIQKIICLIKNNTRKIAIRERPHKPIEEPHKPIWDPHKPHEDPHDPHEEPHEPDEDPHEIDDDTDKIDDDTDKKGSGCGIVLIPVALVASLGLLIGGLSFAAARDNAIGEQGVMATPGEETNSIVAMIGEEAIDKAIQQVEMSENGEITSPYIGGEDETQGVTEEQEQQEAIEEIVITEQKTVMFYDINNIGEDLKTMVAEVGQEGLTTNILNGENSLHGKFYECNDQFEAEEYATKVYQTADEIKNNVKETMTNLIDLTSQKGTTEEQKQEMDALVEYCNQTDQQYEENLSTIYELAEKFATASEASKDELTESEIAINNGRLEEAKEQQALAAHNTSVAETLKEGLSNGTVDIKSITKNLDGSYTIVYDSRTIVKTSTISEEEVEQVAEEANTNGLTDVAGELTKLEQTDNEIETGETEISDTEEEIGG